MDTQIQKIIEVLNEKASVKQITYKKSMEVLQSLKNIASGIAKELSEYFIVNDPNIKIEYKDVSEYEFQLRYSGDLLTVSMHSNIITFPDDHFILESEYIKEDPLRGYFGQILFYNFMADSFTYKRTEDLGYLVSRLLVNKDQHFFIEGLKKISFLNPDISQNILSDTLLKEVLISAILLTIDVDLVVLPFSEMQIVSVGEKIVNQQQHAAQKLGFEMKNLESPKM